MAHTSKNHALRYITRMDYARTSSWWVRFYAGTRLLAGKLFSDKKHGGKSKALQAAQAWRDENEPRWATVRPGGPVFVRQNSRNVSGVIGVTLEIRPHCKGNARFSWAALWSEAGRQRRRLFNVKTHGYRRSFQMAVDFRHDKVGLPRVLKTPPPLHVMLDNRTY